MKVLAHFSVAWRALSCVLLTTLAARSQVQLLGGDEPQHIFSGQPQTISVLWRNGGGTALDLELRMRLYQASSSTAALWQEAPWKQLRILPGQTVVESAQVNLPTVVAETRFLVQWLSGVREVLGTSQLLAYPPDLAKDLKPLCGGEALGVFDPTGELKQVLKRPGIEFVDLEREGLSGFTGKLAILGPFAASEQMTGCSRSAVSRLAKRGVAVVWLQPPPKKRAELVPGFYTVPLGKGVVVVVQHDLLKNLAGSPQAQTKLIRLCKLAAHPEPLDLPAWNIEPSNKD